MHYISLEQAVRAIGVGFKANIPIGVWGAPGIGKSSIIQQLPERLDGEWTDAEIFDLRLSDKEPSDIGGIPFPEEIQDTEDPKHRMKKVLRFLVMDLLPFDSQKRAIVLLDEFDRADLSVQNAALQLILDRKVNGHKLSPNARIVLAGNNATDIGTSPLSAAAANRMCHLYIEIGNQAGLESFLDWADNTVDRDGYNPSPLIQGFAGYSLQTFTGGKKDAGKIEELAYPTPRSFVYADKLMQAAQDMPFDCEDVVPALIAGCVGRGAASQFLAYREIYQKLPTPEQIIANPEGVPLPKNPSTLYAHKKQLCIMAKESDAVAEAVAKYGIRWEEEPAADLFRMLKEAKPSIVDSPTYKKYVAKRGGTAPVASSNAHNAIPEYKAFCMSCKKQVVMKNPVVNKTTNGRAQVNGTCETCSGKVVKIIGAGELANPKANAGQGVNLLTPQATLQLSKNYPGAIYQDEKLNNDPVNTNKMKIMSSSGRGEYVISQNRKTADWQCSCQGWKTHRNCKHLDELYRALGRIGTGIQ